MTISVCVGSSCHIKGSRFIIERLQVLVDKHRVSEKIEIRAVLCMDNCMNGVCVKADGDFYSLSPETVDDFFEHKILPIINTEKT